MLKNPMATEPRPKNKTFKIFSLSSYAVKRPTYTTLSIKNIKNAVDFRSEEKAPCKNTWYRDLKATHIRNRQLLDLPFHVPKCCSDVYNIILDRKKQQKLKKFDLTRPIRTATSTLEPEEVERCIPKEVSKSKITIFPECFNIQESSSDDDDDDESVYELCRTGSESICSGCSTLEDAVNKKRAKWHKVVKPDWKSLLHVSEREICQDAVAQEVKKHKQGHDFPLKLKKFL